MRHSLLATCIVALATACGSTPSESSATDSAATDSAATEPAVTTDATISPTGEPTTQPSEPTGGMSQASDTGPVPATDTTNTEPATSDTTATTQSPLDTSDTGDTDTTMGVVDDTGDTSTGTTADDTTTAGDDTTTTETTEAPPDPCEPVLHAVIRDFSPATHPDFETYGGTQAYKGLVKPDLGPDMKPVYAAAGPTPQTTGPNEFKQWYNDTPGINQTFEVDLPLAEIQPGLFQFADNTFFPIDGLGYGSEGFPHNFHFTTEIHTSFAYNGGEVFTFTGDDDVWVFINGKLAIDLGGLHPQLSDSVDLDVAAAGLGIVKGNVYTMDLFHAERRYDMSNFRIDTTIGCFKPQ